MQRPQTSIPVSQGKFERFYRRVKNDSGGTRPGTPSQNVLARPPSSSFFLNRASTDNLHQMNLNIMERPITQHGVAGIRPGTARGLTMTRQIQDKRYYIGLMQLKIRELNQEIGTIMKDIESQNKERATYMHYDKRAKDLATELTILQGQLADYNIVVDKMTSDVTKEIIEQETEELAARNEHSLLKIENMFEERKKLEQKLTKIGRQLEDEKKRTERLVESMDIDTKEKYDKLLNEKTKWQKAANEMQQELDRLYKEQLYLEEEITLSPLKQEAVKLYLKVIETEEKRDKLREEEKHRISPEEEKKNLLLKIKQDNMDIAAAEAQLTEKKKRIHETEQKLEQLEIDIDDTQSEKQIKYKELRKREEIIEQFMASFEQNKEDETKKLQKLENTVVEHLGNISNILNIDINFTGTNEMAILNSLPLVIESEYSNNEENFERLAKDNLRLQQIFSEMQILEQKLQTELTDLNERTSNKDNELVILKDLDSLKAALSIRQGQLITECEQLKHQQLENEEELKTIQFEYDEIKQRLQSNDIYSQINVLENNLEKLMQEHKKVEDFVVKEKEHGNYNSLKNNAFNAINIYSSMLKENLKTVY
ncbi:intraflagellar transport protein 74 homolog isoform X2 [Xylocopa sonorina]|uniref:intraflagellar transport protein 74 homolog isoform X2 n=1 Tax=Xylocopa sonorina TaxID=1818115 RepID=UPI00403B24F5